MKDLNLLLVFESLWLDRSVTVAGERMGVSQAAVSASLRRLREEYKDKLFTLVGRKMQPTPLATNIAPQVMEALALVRRTQIEPASFDPSTASRMFVIRTRDVGESVCLPSVVQALISEAPGIQIRTTFCPLDETVAGLSGGQIDLALGFLPALEADIHKRRLFVQHYVCVMRRKHPLAKQKLTKAALKNQQHLLVEYSGSGHTKLEKALVQLSGKGSIKVRIPQYLSAPYFIANSDLLWIAPAVLAEKLAQNHSLQIQPVPVELPNFEVALYWHERYHTDLGNRWLREYITTKVQDELWRVNTSEGH
jgi:DNA-binding transcriptional LysR family regulator